MTTTATINPTAPTSAPTRPLTVSDRCDRCPAQAFVRVLVPTTARLAALRAETSTDVSGVADPGELLFCGHHGRAYEPASIAAGALIDDQTHRINLKPSVSANAD